VRARVRGPGAQRRSESDLQRHIRLVRPARRLDGFFLRAESVFNVATQIDDLGVGGAYGVTSLHEQSHGESFREIAPRTPPRRERCPVRVERPRAILERHSIDTRTRAP
jgi:predicted ATPase